MGFPLLVNAVRNMLPRYSTIVSRFLSTTARSLAAPQGPIMSTNVTQANHHQTPTSLSIPHQNTSLPLSSTNTSRRYLSTTTEPFPITKQTVEPDRGLYHPEDEHGACGVSCFVNKPSRIGKIKTNHKIVAQGLNSLKIMQPRGARGIGDKPDGCGMTLLHTTFFEKLYPELNLEKGKYGILHFSVPKNNEKNSKEHQRALDLLAEIMADLGLEVCVSRKTPTNPDALNPLIKDSEPDLYQWIATSKEPITEDELQRRLDIAYCRFEQRSHQTFDTNIRPYMLSTSTYQIVYKGIVAEEKLGEYLPDLLDKRMDAAAVEEHSRFATNAKPHGFKAHPFNRIAMNGENNGDPQVRRFLENDPDVRTTLGLDKIDLKGYSDTAVIDFYILYLSAKGFSEEEIVCSLFNSRSPTNKTSSDDFQQLGIGFALEGPHHVMFAGRTRIYIFRDGLSLRPQVGYEMNGQFYSGSEFSDSYDPDKVTRFSVEPARPYYIDLKTGERGYVKLPADVKAYHDTCMANIKTLDTSTIPADPYVFSNEEIEKRKRQAGWTKEFDQAEMQPLLQGKIAKISMGKRAPEESLIVSPHLDWQQMMKATFAQVTNPPIAFHQNRRYMSLEVLVGGKISFDKLLKKEPIDGIRLPSPMINKCQMAALKKALPTETIDLCCFDIQQDGQTLRNTLSQLVEQALNAAKNGQRMILLSDLKTTLGFAPIPTLIVASAIHQALTKAGLRRQVSLAVESADAIGSSKTAQLVSLAGVDVVNPYLADTPEYLHAIDDELINYMARIGIQSLQVYQGGFWNAVGYTKELADFLGVRCSLHGDFGLDALASTITVNYMMPVNEGLGNAKTKVDNPDRERHWKPGVVKKANQAGQTLDWRQNTFLAKSVATEANRVTKTSSLRGFLELAPPLHWTSANPPPIAIIGAGAAGLLLAKRLKEAGFNVTLFEENVVPNYGQVGDGIAPDHTSVKNNTRNMLNAIRHAPNITTYYGLHIGHQPKPGQPAVSVETLKQHFALVVDATGAGEDIKLGVKGESLPRVMSASRVTSWYNQKFSPYQTNAEGDCLAPNPFLPSYNPNLCVIGMGNVAADIVRLNPSPIIHLFARGGPETCRITLPMLEELKEKGFQLYTNAQGSSLADDKLSDDQKRIVEFFKILPHDTTPLSAQSNKCIFFHFNTTVETTAEAVFEETNHAVKVNLRGPFGQYAQEFSHVITALGRTPSKALETIDKKVGWATGMGGALPKAKESANQLADEIIRAFDAECGLSSSEEMEKPYFQSPKNVKTGPLTWTHQALTKEDINRIEAWLQAGKSLRTLEDFAKAKAYMPQATAPSQTETIPTSKVLSPLPTTPEEQITIITASGEMQTVKVSDAKPDQSLMQFARKTLGDEKAPAHACGGNGTCIECGVVLSSKVNVTKVTQQFIAKTGMTLEKERTTIAEDDKYKTAGDLTVLSCAHPAKAFDGMTVQIPTHDGQLPLASTPVNPQVESKPVTPIPTGIQSRVAESKSDGKDERKISEAELAELKRQLPKHPSIPGASIVRALAHPGLIESWIAALSDLEKQCLAECVCAGGISFGAISLEAHMELARTFNTIRKALGPHAKGPYSNSGEGGEIPARDDTIFQSFARQVASGRFSLRLEYLAYAKLIEIKIVQGAKPGDGGTMPAFKVSAKIAETRGTPEGIELQSPGPMTDLFSIEDLKALIHALRSINPDADISVKLAATEGIGAVAAGVAKAGARIINISGVGAGTGAATSTAVNHVAMSIEQAIAEVHQTLMYEGLRSSVKICVSGSVKTALDIFKLQLLGADRVELGTGLLIQLGCLMAELCHAGLLSDDPDGEIKGCPVGIATQAEKVIKKLFKGTAEGASEYLINLIIDLVALYKRYGIRSPEEVVGRTDLLRAIKDAPVDVNPLLHKPPTNPVQAAFGPLPRVEGSSPLENILIQRILSGERKLHVKIDPTVRNFGARMGYFSVTNPDFKKALEEGVEIYFEGAPGDGFGSFMPKGITCYLQDLPNNTMRSLAGAKVHVDHMINNGALYGAREGEVSARFIGDNSLYAAGGSTQVITEEVGNNVMQFARSGVDGAVVVLGDETDYPQLQVRNHKKAVKGRENVVGDNFGAGMVAGNIIMPKKRIEKCRKHCIFSETLQNTPATPLSENGKAILRHGLFQLQKTTNKHKVSSALVKELNQVIQSPEGDSAMEEMYEMIEVGRSVKGK